MSILLVLFISVVTFILSKYIFKKWFNHLLLYTLAWTMFLVLYELKFIRYIPISNEAFFIFFVTHIGVISGALTVYFARNVFIKNKTENNNSKFQSVLFDNDFKVLKILIVITSIIGLYSAYQNWTYLLEKFGNITTIIIRAHTIYKLRVAGEIDGGTPYLSIFPYAGIVLSGIYTAAKSRISFYSILPLVAIIISDVASIGRGGIFVGFSMLVTSFFLFRHVISENYNLKIAFNRKALVIGNLIVIIIFLSSLTLVSELRGKFQDYKGKSRSFNKFDDIPFFSAAEYFYFSSNVGVFSKYFELQVENPMIGENTFLPVYNLISKFGIIEHPNFYPRGYSIPSWSNAATYLKDIHADFGNIGLFLIPYLLSFICTFFWFRLYNNGDFISIVCLTYLYVVVSLSVFNMQTRSAFFLLSFLLLLLINSIVEKYYHKLNLSRNYIVNSEKL